MLEQLQPLQIYNIINSLNTNKACGQDNVSSWFLRVSGKVLAPILSSILVWL